MCIYICVCVTHAFLMDAYNPCPATLSNGNITSPNRQQR